MASLASHANVWSTCLKLLHRKGFRLRVDLAAEDKDPDSFVAEKHGFVLVADNPIELLGLAAIHEEVNPEHDRPYWWSIEGSGPSRGQLIDEALARRETRERDLKSLRKASPDLWVLRIEMTLDDSGSLSDAASQLGISADSLRMILEDPLLRKKKRPW